MGVFLVVAVDIIVRILRYYGPQTYDDMVLQGLKEDVSFLEDLVERGIIQKEGDYFLIGRK